MNPNTKIDPEQLVHPSAQEGPIVDTPRLPVVDASGGYESLDGPEPTSTQISPASNQALKQMIEQNPTYSEQAVTQSFYSVPTQATNPKRPSSGLGKMIKRFALAAVAVVLLAGGGVYIAASRAVVNQSTVEETPEQLVDIQGESAFSSLKVLDSVDGPRLVINGDLLTTGSLYFGSGGFAGEFATTALSSNQSYLLPDSSGEICLDSNNCNFASPEDVQTATAIQGGAGIVYTGRTIVNTGLLSLNSASGDVTIQGTTNQITVNRSGKSITFSLPQDLNLTSSPSFTGITVTDGTIGTLAITTGTQNGNLICDSSNNCGYAGGANAFIDGGNSFGAQAILGTNDTNSLSFETDGVTRLTIDAVGDATFTGSVAAADFTGDGSNLTNLNASNIASGTLDDARLTSNVAMRNSANTFTTGNQLIQTGAAGVIGLTVQGFAGQTANLQEWQSSTGTVLASVSATGAGSFVSLTQNGNNVCDISNNCSYAVSSGSTSYIQNGTSIQTNANLAIQSAAAGSVGAVIRGAASQTANLQEWQDSTGSILQYVAAGGGTIYNRSTASTGYAMAIYDTGIGNYPFTLSTSTGSSGGLHSSLTLNGSGYSSNGGVLIVRSAGDSVFSFDAPNRVAVFNSQVQTRIEPYSAASTGLIIRGKASQSGSLQVWQNSSATVLASISASGVGSFANVLQNGNQVCDNTNNCSYAPSSGSTSYIQNGTSIQSNANIAIQSSAAGSVGAVIRGAVGQTANFQEWQSSGGSVVARIAANGYIYASGLVSTSAPASSGFVRLSNTESIAWRNAANSADYTLGLNSSDQLVSTAPLWINNFNGLVLAGTGGSGQIRTLLSYTSANELLDLSSNGSVKMRLTASNGVQFGAYSLTGGTNERLSVKRFQA